MVCLGQTQSETVEGMAMVYRGTTAERYYLATNGTPYIDNLGFLPGEVMYNGVLYEDVSVNVDAVRGQLLAMRPGSASAVNVDRDQVSWFTRGGEKYINLEYQGYSDAPAGYWRVVYAGSATVFEQCVKVRQSGEGYYNTVADIGYEDPNYNPSNPNYYAISKKYVHLKDGKVSVFTRKKDLAKLYKENKQQMNRYAVQHGLKASSASVESYILGVMPLVDSGESNLAVAKWHPVEGEGTDNRVPAVKRAVITGPATGVLPSGYFEEKTSKVEYSKEDDIDATYSNKVYVIGDEKAKRVSRARVSGKVTDRAEGTPLEAVVVFDENTGTYARTNSKGEYSLNLPTGENIIHFNDPAKNDVNIRVILYGDGGLNVSMRDKVTELESAIVSAESMQNHRTPQMGVERISMKTISKIPSAFGEGDIVKAVLALPGVKTVGEASSGFNVRGGASDQNLILFNGSTIYNTSHLFGIFSAFNPDIVEGVELYKSSIPAEYGGRISSVMEINCKEGDPEKIKGSLGLGLLTSRFHLEGPISKGRTTFILGARTTYSDWLLKQLPKDSEYSNGTAGFMDANLGITHKFDEKNTIQVFGYYSRDRFGFTADTTFYYNNLNASVKFKHKRDEDFSYVASAGIDHFGNRLEDSENFYEGYKLKTDVDQAYAKLDLKNKLGDHLISYGGGAILYRLNPGEMTPLDEDSYIIEEKLDLERGIEGAAYVSDTWTLNDALSLDAGVRLSGFMALDPSKMYIGPEFRVSGKYTITPGLSAKAGFNTLRQYIHLISNTTAISPMDTWKLSDADVKPTEGWQAATGLYWTVMGGRLDLSLEGYWKQMKNYLDYKQGAVLTMNENLVDDLTESRGKAWGIELMAKKSTGKLNGWMTYSYSRSFLQESVDRGVNTINGGDWYRAPYDKPHEFKLVGTYNFTRRYSISANVDYSTGRPVTIPVGKFLYGGGYRLLYSERNEYRIPDYFRLDLALNIEPGHYLKKLTHMSITLGCYNVTGRKNAYSVYYTSSGGNDIKGYKVSVFATQIPYINLNILF